MLVVPRNLHTKYLLNTTEEKGVIKVSLWLPWQLSYYSNEVHDLWVLSQRTSIPNMNSMRLKTKELLRFQSGCHGNWVTIATRYVVDVYCLKEPLCQI